MHRRRPIDVQAGGENPGLIRRAIMNRPDNVPAGSPAAGCLLHVAEALSHFSGTEASSRIGDGFLEPIDPWDERLHCAAGPCAIGHWS
jgi:hypothetical protein